MRSSGISSARAAVALAAWFFVIGWPVLAISPQFREVTVSKETAPEGDEKSPRASFKATLAEPSDPGTLQDAVRRELYGGQSPEAYAEGEWRSFSAAHREAVESLGKTADTPSALLRWESIEEVDLVASFPRAVVLRRSYYRFTGGAHGNHGTDYTTIDPKDDRRLVLSDIVEGTSSPQLLDLAAEAIREKFGVAADTLLTMAGLFSDTLTLTDDFAFASDGLILQWDPYSIAPYSVGEIEGRIPYSRLRSLLTERGKEIVSSIEAKTTKTSP